MLSLIDKTPFDATAWPGNWVWTQDSGDSFEVVQFSCLFPVNDVLPVKFHISADNRYKLYIDGKFIGLGPQRGTLDRYFFDTYDLSSLSVESCQHIFSAVVWHERDTAPSAQISSRPGFLAVAEYADGKIRGPLKTWKYKRLSGNRLIQVPEEAICTGAGYDMCGFRSGYLCPAKDEFEKDFIPVKALGYSSDHKEGHPQLLLHWELTPRTIPALESKVEKLGRCRRVEVLSSFDPQFQISCTRIDSLISTCDSGEASQSKETLRIPPKTHLKFLLDNTVLTMGYPVIIASKGEGAVVTLAYQEALQSCPSDILSKGNRDEIQGRTVSGKIDKIRPDGSHQLIFEPFWFRCWRYIEFDIVTSNEPLEINLLYYRNTGYPLQYKADIKADQWLNRLVVPGFRTMRLCAGETYFDCPYYEQLQYVGDTRIMALLSFLLCGDDRLAREAIDAFDRSRIANGLTQCSYPANHRNVIPLFSLIYIAMLNDFLMWRGDVGFVRKYMLGVRAILNGFETFLKSDGLVGKISGWAFVDWIKGDGWENGAPLAANEGNSFLINFFYLYGLQQAGNLYLATGDKKNAAQIDSQAKMLQHVLQKEAFDAKRQVFVDDPSGSYLSQHTNILAILTDTHLGVVDGQILLDNILNKYTAAEATVYFKFYLFEAMHHIGRADMIWPELKLWHDMLDNGLTTFAETPEPSRSDCHAWSSHPLYHFFASILGVRPLTPGCQEMTIRPACPISETVTLPESMGGSFMTPHGKCTINLKVKNNYWQISKEFPAGIKVTDLADSNVKNILGINDTSCVK